MRMVFSVVSLLVVVLIVGMIAKKQLGTPVAADARAVTESGAPAMRGTPQQQVQQYKQAVEGAMQQARPMPDDAK